VLDEFYSKASDANKKKAVEVLDRLMGEQGKGCSPVEGYSLDRFQ